MPLNGILDEPPEVEEDREAISHAMRTSGKDYEHRVNRK